MKKKNMSSSHEDVPLIILQETAFCLAVRRQFAASLHLEHIQGLSECLTKASLFPGSQQPVTPWQQGWSLALC